KHFGKQTAELLEAGKVDDDLEHALMDLSDSLEGQYPRKTLAMMYGGVFPEKQNALSKVLEVYLDYEETGYAATDHRLRVRLDKCKADLIEALGSAKVEKLSVKDIKRQDANAYRDLLLSRMSANSVARYKNTINAAMNWYIKENALDMLSPFAGLLIKGAGASKTDRLPLTDDHLKQLASQLEYSDAAWALYVTLRDIGARLAEVAGLRIKYCNVEQGSIHIFPTPWRRLKNKSSKRSIPLSKESMAGLRKVSQDRGPEDPVFVRYANREGLG
ncbi:MAG: integrase, partial [Aestuariivita sp.]|nr:integrase [Aestuariivita sp.]